MMRPLLRGPPLEMVSRSVSLGCHFAIGAKVALEGLTMVPIYLHAS